MVGDHEPMPVGRQPDQREAKQRRTVEIEALGAVPRQDAGQPLNARILRQQRQIDMAPGHHHLRHDDLHRPAEVLMPEARPQAAMARHQRLRRRFQGCTVERPFQAQLQLHRIDVRRLRIIERMEQQPLLQRRQRQDVLDRRSRALQPLDLGLRQRHQRQIARGAAAGAGRRRMANQRPEHPEPVLSEIANRSFRHQRRRP